MSEITLFFVTKITLMKTVSRNKNVRQSSSVSDLTLLKKMLLSFRKKCGILLNYVNLLFLGREDLSEHATDRKDRPSHTSSVEVFCEETDAGKLQKDCAV